MKWEDIRLGNHIQSGSLRQKTERRQLWANTCSISSLRWSEFWLFRLSKTHRSTLWRTIYYWCWITTDQLLITWINGSYRFKKVQMFNAFTMLSSAWPSKLLDATQTKVITICKWNAVNNFYYNNLLVLGISYSRIPNKLL